MVIRHNRMHSGEVYTVHMVKSGKTKLGQQTWHVFCGSKHKRPEWIPLRFTQNGVPYFWFNRTRLYLNDFKAA